MWPLLPSHKDFELIAHAIEQMAQGNYDVSVPTLKGQLAPLSATLKQLKQTYTSTFISLEKQQDDMRALIDALPNALLFVADGRVSLLNRAACELLELKPTDAGKPLDGLDIPRTVLDAMESFVSSEAARLSIRTKPNALMRTFQITLSQLEGHVPSEKTLAKAHFVASFTDISQRVKTDALRKDFVSAASHELKTPVAGMSLMSETARMALKDGDLDTASAMLEHIHSEAENLQALVADLLDLARYEDMAHTDERADLIKAAKTTLATRAQSARAKGLELRAEFGNLGPQEVFVPLHEADVIIILDNLVDNAIAYTDSGSVCVSITRNKEAHSVRIDVSDSGIGIDEKDFERIFERFYRIDKSRSRMSGGTGLGLSLVKHAVEQAGGEITVASQKNVGTTLRVTLPLL